MVGIENSSALVFLSMRRARMSIASLDPHAAGLTGGPDQRTAGIFHLVCKTSLQTQLASVRISQIKVARASVARFANATASGPPFCATTGRLGLAYSVCLLLTAAGRVRQPRKAHLAAAVRRPGGEKSGMRGWYGIWG